MVSSPWRRRTRPRPGTQLGQLLLGRLNPLLQLADLLARRIQLLPRRIQTVAVGEKLGNR